MMKNATTPAIPKTSEATGTTRAFLVIETTGAGDTFCACVLHNVLENGVENRSADSLRAMLRFANAAAYLVTTKKGAIRSMPEQKSVEQILMENP